MLVFAQNLTIRNKLRTIPASVEETCLKLAEMSVKNDANGWQLEQIDR